MDEIAWSVGAEEGFEGSGLDLTQAPCKLSPLIPHCRLKPNRFAWIAGAIGRIDLCGIKTRPLVRPRGRGFKSRWIKSEIAPTGKRKKQLELNSRSRERDIMSAVGIGHWPGLSSLLALHASRMLEDVEEIERCDHFRPSTFLLAAIDERRRTGRVDSGSARWLKTFGSTNCDLGRPAAAPQSRLANVEATVLVASGVSKPVIGPLRIKCSRVQSRIAGSPEPNAPAGKSAGSPT